MRDPARWRRISLGFLAAGIAAAALVWWLTVDTPAPAAWRLAMLCFAPVAILGGGIGALVAHSRLRLQRRLLAGDDVVARWRVDPDTWQRFVGLNDELQAQPGMPLNELAFPERIPADGVTIVVGRGAVVVGDAVHVVPERGTPEVLSARLDDRRLKCPYVELQLQYASVDGPALQTLLRFPVADGALRAARDVAAHFARETPGRPDFFHGPGDGSDPEDLSKCWSCGFETHTFRSACPRCGATLQSRRWSRRLGAVLVILGGGLAGGMWLLLKILGPTLRQSDDFTGPMRFSGTPTQATAILVLLSLILAFGVATFGYGMFQMVTGRRSRIVVQGMLGLVAAAVVLGLLLAR